MLAMVFAFSAIIAGPASAKLSKSQKAHVRAQLRKQIKKHPKLIRSKHFIKKAALVNFKLPVTIKLRTPCAAADGTIAPTPPLGAKCVGTGTGLNQETRNTATIDLGPSLGQRTIQLGGSLKAEITFADSFDGGALGNVKLALLPDPSKGLVTSSIPLLWNTDVSGGSSRSDVNFAKAGRQTGSVAFNGAANTSVSSTTQGCQDFTAAAPGNTNATSPLGNAAGTPGYNALWYGSFGDITTSLGTNPFGLGAGLPGYPYVDLSDAAPSVPGFLPIYPGIDDWNNLKAGTKVGDNNYLGPNPDPFPQGAPYAPGAAPNVHDTVLRTNALKLDIAAPGPRNQSNGNGPEGSDNIVVGSSGGEANLFGNIPGKSNGIDVTLSLDTDISSIIRIADQDVFSTPLQSGQPYPAGIFNCRQVWTGKVANTIPGVRLTGDLKISPGITKEGDLRIAKATIQSPSGSAARVALAACLMPFASYSQYSSGYSDLSVPAIPTKAGAAAGTPASFGTGLIPFNSSVFPVQNLERVGTGVGQDLLPPAASCGDAPSGLVANSALPASLVHAPPGVSQTGKKVSVAGDLTVNPVSVDVIIGNV
jgi:hypothetical protein